MDYTSEEEYDAEDIIDNNIPVSESENEDYIDTENINTKIEFNAKIRTEMINKRTDIEFIKTDVINKLADFEKLKGELKTCNNHILELQKEEELTLTAIETNKINENLAAVFRLQGQLKRIQIEKESENDVLNVINDKLNTAEQLYIKAQLKESKILLDDYELQDKEKEYDDFQNINFKKRMNKEKQLTENALKSLDMQKSEFEEQQKYHEEILQNQLDDITKAHQNHSKYLKKTMRKKNQAQIEAENKQRNEEEKRDKSFNKLNTDIQAIKENMAAINSKRLADQKKDMEKENEIKKSVKSKGGNPLLEIKKIHKIKQMKEEKEKLENKIQENKIQIAAKITGEDNNMKRKQQLQPYLFGDPLTKKLELPKIKSLDVEKVKQLSASLDSYQNEEEMWQTWEKRSNAGESSIAMTMKDGKSLYETVISTNKTGAISTEDKEDELNLPESSDDDMIIDNPEDDIRQPEFGGMWDKDSSKYSLASKKQDQKMKDPNSSKMEQDIMARVLRRLRENIIAPQVVSGKVFNGQVFQSKPDIIKFEDLEVGKSYDQKIILTNTSYCTSQCRYESMSDNLLDFVNVKFSPPGPLSPGMTCEFYVYFNPKLDVDIYGELYFCSKSEKFTIPLACLTKKTKMTISQLEVDFGHTIIEEVLTRTIVLKNQGAKGTYCGIGQKVKSVKIDEDYLSDEETTDVKEPTESKSDIKDANDNIKTNEAEDENEDDSNMVISLGNEKVWIEGFSELEVIIKWNPMKSGDYKKEFFINFDDPDNEGFIVTCTGHSLDVPVYTKQQVMVMDICMLDRLYQDSIIFYSRAPTALKLQFHVPSSVTQYLEILPTTGFIQAGQSFKAQLKLLPRSSIYGENCKYFDATTGLLDVPITASIAGQVKTVDFQITAILTNTDLELSILKLNDDSSNQILDFGKCSIRETRIKQIKLINKSILAQEFGFTGYPQCVEIQPNFGYGTILPGEELIFDVLFSPTKADDYRFKIQCQTIIDRLFTLECCAIGVHPNLDLNPQILQLPFTSIGDTSSITFTVDNSHLSTNIYTHEPPRVGKEGPVCSVNVRTFHFILPDNSSLTIYPAIASVQPGKSQKITIVYKPTINDNDIQQEAAELMTEKLQIQAQTEWDTAVHKLEEEQKQTENIKTPQSGKRKKSAKKPTKGATAGGKDKKDDDLTLEQLLEQGPKQIEPLDPHNIVIGSDDFMKGRLSLISKYHFKLDIFKIKCYVAEGDIKENSGSSLNYDHAHTGYLEVHCPSVPPELVLLSDFGRQTIDFGDNIVSRRISKNISIKNISGKIVKLRSTPLHPDGTFDIRTPFRNLKPNQTTNILLSYCPTQSGVHQTDWQLFPVNIDDNKENRGKKLTFRLKGKAALPNINIPGIDPETNIFDCGKILVNEYTEKMLAIENQNDFKIRLYFKLKSHFDLMNVHNQKNQSGLSVFDISPQYVDIEPGKSQNVTVTFSADHESDKFHETVQIVLFNEVLLKEMKLLGQAKSKMMFVYGPKDFMEIPRDYLGEIWRKHDEEINQLKCAFVIELISKYEDDTLIPAESYFYIGCTKTLQANLKKNGEFSIENLSTLSPLGIQIEPSKGQVDSDSDKSITVTWNPPNNTEMGQVISTNITLLLKSDISTTYSIDVRAVLR